MAESLPGQAQSGLHADVDPETGIVIRQNADGSRILETPDGKTVVESEQNGSHVSETTYTRDDGAHVTEWEATHPNGDQQRDVQVESDGVIDRLHTSTYRSDQHIQSLIGPATAELLARDPNSDPRGSRNPTVITNSFRSITDTRQTPPAEQVLEAITTYEQFIPVSKGEGDAWEQQLGSPVDREHTGTTVTVSTSTAYDASGNPNTVTETSSVTRAAIGRPTAHGEHPRVIDHTEHTVIDGELRQTAVTHFDQHVFDGEQALPNAYNDRIGNPAAQHAETTVTRYDNEGRPTSETIRSFGDNLDDPTRDGRSVTVHTESGRNVFEYTEVFDQGRSLNQQISYQGTDTRIIHRVRPLEGGGSTRHLELREGDAPPSFVSEERTLPGQPPGLEVRIDGRVVEGVADDGYGVREAASLAKKGHSAAHASTRLHDAAHGTQIARTVLASGATAASGLLGLGLGGVALYEALQQGDGGGVAKSIGGLVKDSGDVLKGGGQVAQRASTPLIAQAGSALETGGRVLAPLGATIGIASGTYEISQGNHVEGALDVAGGVATALGAYRTTPGALLTLAVLGGRYVKWGLEEARVPPLEV